MVVLEKMVLTIPSTMTAVLILTIVSTLMENEQKKIFTGIASTDIVLSMIKKMNVDWQTHLKKWKNFIILFIIKNLLKDKMNVILRIVTRNVIAPHQIS